MKAFEKIKERLEEEHQQAVRDIGLCDSFEEVNYAAGRVAAFENAQKIVSEVEAKHRSGWIPCEKELPEDGVDVLVQFEYFRYGEYNRMYKTKGIGTCFEGRWLFINGSTGWRDLKVFAWQPLPDDYDPEETAGLDFSEDKEYNNFRENNEEGSTMRDIMCLCEKHPEKEQIFSLVKMLTEAGHPFHFNFYEDLKPTPFGQEGDPETDIDWEQYHFLVEVGEPVEPGLSEISVCFNQDPEYDLKLLELVDARKAPKVVYLHRDFTAEKAMEIIEEFFEAK